MYCRECGEENRNDRKFCTNCGAELRDYTKPRENLIMSEEIEQKQNKVANYNQIIFILNIMMWITLTLAIGFTVATLFTKGTIQLVFIITCLIFLFVYIILMIAKIVLNKKKNKTNK